MFSGRVCDGDLAAAGGDGAGTATAGWADGGAVAPDCAVAATTEAMMARTLMASSMVQAMGWLDSQAEDGDTIRLIWDGASRYSIQVVENRAVGLGLDVVVEVGPPRISLGGTEQEIVIDLLPSVVLHKEVEDGDGGRVTGRHEEGGRR